MHITIEPLGISQGLHRVVEPGPVELALARLDPGPRELGDPDVGDAQLPLALRVTPPLLPGDVLRVIADAEGEGCGGVSASDGSGVTTASAS